MSSYINANIITSVLVQKDSDIATVLDQLVQAWKHWRDPTLGDSYTKNEVIRSLHIGLHCVQDNPADSPTMATVVLMLNNDSVILPLPQRPAYFFRSRTEDNKRSNEPESNQSTSKSISYSANEA